MMRALNTYLSRIPRAWLIAGASLLGVVVVVGSVAMYRVYDYVQHDNNFCMNCHLMSGPFNRFQQSAHRGLGCKACHRPNIIQRSKMGLTQILEMPDSISHHAEVPKEICGECHIKGNPKEWKLVANSVGHRLHLESKDPALKGLQCVTCHGADIHQFAPVDKTCGKVGCHEGVAVKLGKMSNLTIHCTSCHDFNKPIPTEVQGSNALKQEIKPRGNDCLSCHAMRQRVGADMPADEPHKRVCGSCHNPHEQKTPAEAVRSCTNSGCHERPDTLSPMHKMLAAGVAANCTTCHKAHTWKVKSDACTACHTPEKLDAGMPRPVIKHIDAKPERMSILNAVFPLHLLLQVLQGPAQAPQQPGTPFRHTPHRNVGCASCHATDTGHGVLKIRTAADCAGCHHSQQNVRQCTRCHNSAKLQNTFARTFTTSTSVDPAPRARTLNFDHGRHSKLNCTSCHKDPKQMRNIPSCSSCHDSHHTAERTCTSCHKDVIDSHDRQVHLTCAGSGCHKNTVNTVALRTQRNVCLTCHTDKTKHEPAGDCASCHMIPNRSNAGSTK